MSIKKNLLYPFIFLVLILFGGMVIFPNFQKNIDIENIYNHKRVLNIILLIINSVILLFFKSFKIKTINFWIELPVYIKYSFYTIIFIGFISTILSPFPGWAFLSVSHYILFGIFIISIASIIKNYTFIFKNLLLLSVFLFAVLFTFQTLFTFANSYATIYPQVPRLDSFIGPFSFVHIRAFNHIQTITIPLLGVAVLYSKKIHKSLYFFTFILLSTWWFFVFISGARGTLLAVSFAITSVVILFNQYKSEWFRLQVLSFIIGAVNYFTFFYSPGHTGREVTRISSSGRSGWWEIMILETLEKPIIGYGPMHLSIEGLNLHGHNYFLTMAYEWGLPAVLIFTGVIGYSLYHYYIYIKKDCDTENTVFRISVLISLIAIWVHSFFSGLIGTPLTQLWISVVIGIALGIFFENRSSSKKIKISHNWYFSIFLSFILIVFIASVYPSLTSYKDLEKDYIEKFQPKTLWPGFWKQGKIGWEDEKKHQKVLKEYGIEE